MGFLILLFFIKFKVQFKLPKINEKKKITILSLLIIVGFLATLIQLFALKVNLVPILEVVKRATGIILSLFFGYVIFNEELSRKKVYSVIIIIAGLSLVI